MTTRYRNQSIQMPMKIWTHTTNKNLFRFELPSVILTTPTEWKFDNTISSREEWTHGSPNSLVYVMNTTCIPPFPKGTFLMSLVQNTDPPYETKMVNSASYINLSREQFVVFSYNVPDTIPIYIYGYLDMYNNITTAIVIAPDTSNVVQQRQFQSHYFNFIVYPNILPTLYWKSTTESLCIPTNEMSGKTFSTLRECQKKTYSKVRNRHTWVQNSNEPLYKYMKWWNRLDTDKKIMSLT